MIIRKELKGNYTRIPNEFLQDETISDKARGTLARLLSRPDTWNVNVNHLVKTGKDGHTALRSSLTELVEAGYLHKEVTRGECGRITGTRYVVFDHRVDPAATESVLDIAKCDVTKGTKNSGVTICDLKSKDILSGGCSDVSSGEVSKVASNSRQLIIQEGDATPKLGAPMEKSSQAKTQTRDTHANNDDRMRKTHIRESEDVITNKGINNPKGETTTAPDPEPKVEVVEPPSSYPATEDINSLWDLIPEQHQQPMVKALVNKSAKEYSPLEVREAIAYATANVKGGWMQYKAYLDKTLKNQWAAGYLETMKSQPTTTAMLSPGGFAGAIPAGRYPNGTVTGCKRMDSNYMAAAQFLTEMGVEA
ncbi:hypothetical protein SAMN02746065_1099 [Desulfocicer vacuolatum DSM 3385]|uniref:Helix-turn-helix domain-containing protein n=1 Tax=Desulfocicer vacuolatum DSM 3385 TaxID=1121400 RepID=A0A1W2BNS7_9BACT|nr:hypothetical protein [Desulfocicer vacuolatum]SMC74513.1 hypothetical protein SAMN02746065_1099 [Desulfocicer vacuolatum DSM 3385]